MKSEVVENISMKILIDADACPVVSIVEHVTSKYRIPVILLCDTNHVLQSAYSEVKVIEAGARQTHETFYHSNFSNCNFLKVQYFLQIFDW